MLLDPIKQAPAKLTAIPAPTKGWNKRDPISGMKQGYAVTLDNWFPLPYEIMMRNGSSDWATGIGDPVGTLVVYRPPSGNQEMWAFANDSLYDVSSSGAVGAAAVSSLSNDEWYWINFSTSGGNFAIAVNGQDKLLLYDGTSWAAIDGVSTPSITNIATTSLVNLFVHKERVFYVEKNSLSTWYSAVGAFAGALTEFPLASVFNKGGYLVAGGTWSVDAGDGQDDYAVFITSEGEIAVYAGTDPSSANTWSLIGIFEVGHPIGRRCLLKYGGDLLILTLDGIISAAQAFQQGRDRARQLAITDVIQGAVAEAGPLYKATYGWQMTLFSNASMLLVNVPDSNGVKQWAMNTITKAWGRFKGWEAETFAIFNDDLYFGGDGVVRKAWDGKSDAGSPITAEVVPAFDYYGTKASTKQWTMMRPVIQWDSNPLSIKLGFDVDFVTETPSQEIALASSSTAAIWDTALWDAGTWGAGLSPKADWYSISAIGLAGAPHMIFESAVSAARLSSFDIVYTHGSIFGGVG